MKTTSVLFGFSVAFALLSSPQTQASDGRIEINQASVEAAGGFPFTIDQPGSYVLTGNLTVPAATDGVIIDTGDVSLDLNGFSISGPAVCSTSTCLSGDGEGIRPDNPLQDAHRVTVENGAVKGFANNCIRLRQQAHIDQIKVYQCGSTGISASAKSVVTRSTINATGASGLALSTNSSFAHNTISETGLGGGGQPAVIGGTATAGNYCDDSSCGWADTRRRFYLTNSDYEGDQVFLACADGFHMASFWEILDPTHLRYDTSLGQTTEDSGFGPPTDRAGWVRTGRISSNSGTEPGSRNCSGYTSDEGLGTQVHLPFKWDIPSAGTDPARPPWWIGALRSCGSGASVWCVQD